MIKTKQNWADVSDEPISEDAIRALHVPEESFKLYSNMYEAGQPFVIKAGHGFVLYVLSGGCKTTLDGLVLQLGAGEFAFLDKGTYQFKALDGEQLKVVRVFGR
jgi:hypothetical protein